jgi:hypothetical protein
MPFKTHSGGSEPRFSGRENRASGKLAHPLEPMDGLNISKETGAASVGKILGAGEPGKASGFRPGGHGPGYNHVGGKTGLQVRIPNTRDQSNVHSCAGVDPENILTGGAVEPTKNNV